MNATHRPDTTTESGLISSSISSKKGAPAQEWMSLGKGASKGRGGLWVSIPNPVSAALQFSVLLVGMLVLSHHLIVSQPAMNGANLRAVVAPNHPGSSTGLLTAHTSAHYNKVIREKLDTILEWF